MGGRLRRDSRIGFDWEQAGNEEMIILSEKLNDIALSYGLSLDTCSEEINLLDFGIKAGKCIDNYLIENIIGQKIIVNKDKNQRKECGCVESVDIGEYNTCLHGCLYCYATFNKEQTLKNNQRHNLDSPLLIGEVMENDIVKDYWLNDL